MFCQRIVRVKFGEFQRRSEFLPYGKIVRLAETIRLMNRIMFSDVSDVLGGLDDEDHGDEEREVLLREARDVADVGAGVERDLVKLKQHHGYSFKKLDRFASTNLFFFNPTV